MDTVVEADFGGQRYATPQQAQLGSSELDSGLRIRPLRILIAPDKFKGSLRADEICRILSEVLSQHGEIISCPLSDGGEGFVDTMCAALDGQLVSLTVTDPLGRPVVVEYARCGEVAVMEMARASGLLLLRPDERDPWRASTRGTGEMMMHTVAGGAQKILLGIGGSATNDGGVGMAQALGFRFLDSIGAEIVDLPARLMEVVEICQPETPFPIPVEVACDVENPLLGPMGATRVYGPQKGVFEAEICAHEARLEHLVARVVEADFGGQRPAPPQQAKDDPAQPNAGLETRPLQGLVVEADFGGQRPAPSQQATDDPALPNAGLETRPLRVVEADFGGQRPAPPQQATDDPAQPNAGLETRPLRGLETRPLQGLETRPLRGASLHTRSGSGAAGGLGYGLMAFAGAELALGFDIVADALQLHEKLSWADIVITGEGQLDHSSLSGKAPVALARYARALGKRVIAFCGRCEESARPELEEIYHQIIVISPPELPAADAMQQAAALLRTAAHAIRF
jgi:glycerate kinase